MLWKYRNLLRFRLYGAACAAPLYVKWKLDFLSLQGNVTYNEAELYWSVYQTVTGTLWLPASLRPDELRICFKVGIWQM